MILFGLNDIIATKKPTSLFDENDIVTPSIFEANDEIEENGRILIKRGIFYVDKETGAIVRPIEIEGGLEATSPEAEKIISPGAGAWNLESLATKIEETPDDIKNISAKKDIVDPLTAGVANVLSSELRTGQLHSELGMGGHPFAPTPTIKTREQRLAGGEYFSDKAREMEEASRELIGEDPSFSRQLIAGIPQVAAQIGTYAAAGPMASAGFMGSQILGSEYGEARERDISPEAAIGPSLASTAVQTYLENLLPGHIFEKLRAGGPIIDRIKGLLGSSLLEGTTEGTQEYISMLKELATGKYGDPSKPDFKVKEWFDNLNPAGKRVAMAAGIGAMLGGGVNVAVDVGAETSMTAKQILNKVLRKPTPMTYDQSFLNTVHVKFAREIAPKNEPIDPISGFPQSVAMGVEAGDREAMVQMARMSPVYSGEMQEQAVKRSFIEDSLHDDFSNLVASGQNQEEERHDWVSDKLHEFEDFIGARIKVAGINARQEGQLDLVPIRNDKLTLEKGTIPAQRLEMAMRIADKQGMPAIVLADSINDYRVGNEAIYRSTLDRLTENYESYSSDQLEALYALLSGPKRAVKVANKIEKLLNSRGMTVGPNLGMVVNLSELLSTVADPITAYNQLKISGKPDKVSLDLATMFDSAISGLGSYSGAIDFIHGATTPLISATDMSSRSEGYTLFTKPSSGSSFIGGVKIGPVIEESTYPQSPVAGEYIQESLSDDLTVFMHELFHALSPHLYEKMSDHDRDSITKFAEVVSSEDPDERAAIGLQFSLGTAANDPILQERMVNAGFDQRVIDAIVATGKSFNEAMNRIAGGSPGAADLMNISGVRMGMVRQDIEANPELAWSFLKIFQGKPKNIARLDSYAKYSEMRELEDRKLGELKVAQAMQMSPSEDPEIKVWIDGLSDSFSAGDTDIDVWMRGLDAALDKTPIIKELAKKTVLGISQGTKHSIVLPPTPPGEEGSDDSPIEDQISDLVGGDDGGDGVTIDPKEFRPKPLGRKAAAVAPSGNIRKFGRWLLGYMGQDKTGAARMLSFGFGRDRGLNIPPNATIAGRSYMPGPARDLFTKKIGKLLERASYEVDAVIARFDLLSHDYLDALYKYASAQRLTDVQVEDVKALTTRARRSGDLSLIQDEELRKATGAMMNELDGLSTALAKSGVVPKETADEIMENLGVYLHRDYAAFHTKEWLDIALRDEQKYGLALDRAIERRLSFGESVEAAKEHAIGDLVRLAGKKIDPSAAAAKGAGAKVVTRMDKSELLPRFGDYAKNFFTFRDKYRAVESEKIALGEEVEERNDLSLLKDWAQKNKNEIKNENEFRTKYPLQILYAKLDPYTRIIEAIDKSKGAEFGNLTPSQIARNILDEEDMPRVIRDFLGEIVDPVVATKLSVMHIAHDLIYGKMWSDIRNMGLASGAFVTGGPQMQGQPNVGLTSALSAESFGPMTSRGNQQERIYMTPDAAAFLGAVFEGRKYNTIASMISMWKLGKVVAPAPWMRNIESGFFMLALNGHLQWNSFEALAGLIGKSTGIKRLSSQYGKAGQRIHTAARAAALTVTASGEGSISRFATRGIRENTEEANWILEGVRRGILNPGYNKELLININDLRSLTKNETIGGEKSKAEYAFRVGETLAKIYNTPDILNKMIAFKTECEILAYYYGDKFSNSAQITPEIMDKAADTVNDTYQTYDRLWQFAKDISRGTGSFMSFQVEMVRNMGNAMKHTALWGIRAGEAAKNGDFVRSAKASQIFLTKMSGVIFTTALVKAVLSWWNREHGVEDDIVAAFQRLGGGRGTENSTPLILDKNKSIWNYVDFSNQDPYVFFQKLANIMLTNPQLGVSGKGRALLKEFQQTFLPPGVLWKAVGEAVTGQEIKPNWMPGRDYTASGARLKIPGIDLGADVETRLYRTWRNLGPTVGTDTIEGSMRAGEIGGLRKKMGSRIFTARDMLLRQLGISLQTKDISLPFKTRVSEFRGWKDTNSFRVNNELERIPINDIKERKKIFDQAEKEWRSKYIEFQQNISDALATGVAPSLVQSMLKEANLNEEVRNRLMHRLYTPFRSTFKEREREGRR